MRENSNRLHLLLKLTLVITLSVGGAAYAQQPVSKTTVPDAPPTSGEKIREDIGGSIKTARVYFTAPRNGATVEKTFVAKFAVEGLKVVKAGAIEPGTGHFHIIVDAPAVKEGEVVPTDDKHIHYGQAQTEAKLTLKPGRHTLTLQFADGAHRAYNTMLTQTITVTVR